MLSQAMSAEAKEIAQGGMHQPDLRIRNTLTQSIGRLHLIFVQLVFARLHVDGDELVLVRIRQTGANLALDKRLPTAGELLFAVTALGGSHEFPPVAFPRLWALIMNRRCFSRLF